MGQSRGEWLAHYRALGAGFPLLERRRGGFRGHRLFHFRDFRLGPVGAIPRPAGGKEANRFTLGDRAERHRVDTWKHEVIDDHAEEGVSEIAEDWHF